jgi:hypothetical protein
MRFGDARFAARAGLEAEPWHIQTPTTAVARPTALIVAMQA